MPSADIQEELLDYLTGVLNNPDITPTSKLIESGIIDSLNLIHLILHIEKTYGVKVRAFQAQADHFSDIKSITAFIRANVKEGK